MTELSAEMLGAILTDDRKVARLNELLDQQKANQAILDEANAARVAAEGKLTEARKWATEATSIRDAAEARHAELDLREARMGEVLASLNSEKDAFNAIRAQVEQGHVETGASLNAREAAVSERERAVAERERTAAEDASAAKELRASLDAKHDRLRQALGEDGLLVG